MLRAASSWCVDTLGQALYDECDRFLAQQFGTTSLKFAVHPHALRSLTRVDDKLIHVWQCQVARVVKVIVQCAASKRRVRCDGQGSVTQRNTQRRCSMRYARHQKPDRPVNLKAQNPSRLSVSQPSSGGSGQGFGLWQSTHQPESQQFGHTLTRKSHSLGARSGRRARLQLSRSRQRARAQCPLGGASWRQQVRQAPENNLISRQRLARTSTDPIPPGSSRAGCAVGRVAQCARCERAKNPMRGRIQNTRLN
jgi:hypothetical protein